MKNFIFVSNENLIYGTRDRERAEACPGDSTSSTRAHLLRRRGECFDFVNSYSAFALVVNDGRRRKCAEEMRRCGSSRQTNQPRTTPPPGTFTMVCLLLCLRSADAFKLLRSETEPTTATVCCRNCLCAEGRLARVLCAVSVVTTGNCHRM